MLSREERARQFMPFDALKGFNEALREKEKEYEERRELSEEEINKISEKLKNLDKGDVIKITHYINQKYLTEIITITKIDVISQKIITKENTIIKFIDIFKIVNF